MDKPEEIPVRVVEVNEVLRLELLPVLLPQDSLLAKEPWVEDGEQDPRHQEDHKGQPAKSTPHLKNGGIREEEGLRRRRGKEEEEKEGRGRRKEEGGGKEGRCGGSTNGCHVSPMKMLKNSTKILGYRLLFFFFFIG